MAYMHYCVNGEHAYSYPRTTRLGDERMMVNAAVNGYRSEMSRSIATGLVWDAGPRSRVIA
jgi:hypothetical protein